MDAAHTDVFVLTEVNALAGLEPGGVRSTPVHERANTSWVAVVGKGVGQMGDPRFTTFSCVVGRVTTGEEEVIIVGSVLPWKTAALQAPELLQNDQTYIDMFERTLDEHGALVQGLQLEHRDALVVWAGDFNQSLSGSNVGASNAARKLLREKLDKLGLVAWNEHTAHANHQIKAIDLICGPVSRSVRSIERIDPIRDGIKMSDHAGYVVEIVSAH